MRRTESFPQTPGKFCMHLLTRAANTKAVGLYLCWGKIEKRLCLFYEMDPEVSEELSSSNTWEKSSVWKEIILNMDLQLYSCRPLAKRDQIQKRSKRIYNYNIKSENFSTSRREANPISVRLNLTLQRRACAGIKKLGKIKMASSLNVRRGERTLSGELQSTKANV